MSTKELDRRIVNLKKRDRFANGKENWASRSVRT